MVTGGSKKKPKTTTGIEYGDHMVRVATVSVRSGKTSIRALSQARVEPGRPGVVEDLREGKAAALKEALSRHSKDLGATIVGIPRESIVSRMVSMPSIDSHEVHEMLFFDAERYLPFPAEEGEISYQTLEQVGAAESRVLVVAARRDELYTVLEDLDGIGIHPDRIDVDIHGCGYAVSRGGSAEGEAVALLHLDLRDSTMGLVLNGQLRFSRGLGAGSEDLDNGLSESNPHWKSFVRSMKRSLAGFSHEEFGAKPERIVLCGPGSEIPGIDREIQEAIKIPVAIEKQMDPGRAIEPVSSFGKAIGLALEEAEREHHINLIPEEIYRKYEALHRKRFLVNATFLFVINLFLAGGVLGHDFWHRKEIVRIIDSQIQQIGPKIKDIEEIADKLQVIDDNIDRENSAFEIMKEIFEITPDRVKMDRLSFEKSRNVDLTFDTLEVRDANEYEAILDKSNFFGGTFEGGARQVTPWNPPGKYKYLSTVKVKGLKAKLRSNKELSE